MYELYIDGVLFPVTPGSLNIKINNKNKTITLINEGEVNYCLLYTSDAADD